MWIIGILVGLLSLAHSFLGGSFSSTDTGYCIDRPVAGHTDTYCNNFTIPGVTRTAPTNTNPYGGINANGGYVDIIAGPGGN